MTNTNKASRTRKCVTPFEIAESSGFIRRTVQLITMDDADEPRIWICFFAPLMTFFKFQIVSG